MGMRDRLAVLDRTLVAGRRPAPKPAATPPPVVRAPVAAPSAPVDAVPVAAPPAPVDAVPVAAPPASVDAAPVGVAPQAPAPVAVTRSPVAPPAPPVVTPTPPIVVTFERVPAPAAPLGKVRLEPLRPLHRAGRGLAALWWLFADGVLIGLAAFLRGLRPVRTMAVGAPLACVLVGIAISLWWGSWAYAVIGALAAVCFVWIGREQSPGS